MTDFGLEFLIIMRLSGMQISGFVCNNCDKVGWSRNPTPTDFQETVMIKFALSTSPHKIQIIKKDIKMFFFILKPSHKLKEIIGRVCCSKSYDIKHSVKTESTFKLNIYKFHSNTFRS